MEGFGLLDAARANQQVSALVIRGISDLIYNKAEADKEGYQEIAACNASAFAFGLLAKYRPEQRLGTTTTSQSSSSPSQKVILPLNLPNTTQGMELGATPPKVFISYSHDSQEHKERLLALADRLREDGIDSNIDQYEESPLEGWQRWMLNQVETADFVLIACTEQYDRRFRGHEEIGKGRGATWEGGVIIQELYDAQGQNSKCIPITFMSEDTNFISSPLRSATNYRLNTPDGYEALYRRLTNQSRSRKPELGKLRALPSRNRKQAFSEKTQISPFVAERLKLIQMLNALSVQQFNMLVFALSPPLGLIPPMSASQADRTYVLLNWAESLRGCGLKGLQKVLDDTLKNSRNP